MTTPGGSEFNVQGDDTVAARISVDLPDEAIQRLQQLSQSTSDLQTNMQAVAKSSSDYLDYLRQLPQLLQDAEAAAARFGAAATGQLASPVLAPGGEGRNDAVSTSTLWAPNTGADRDVMADLEELRRTNPRQFANLAAQQAIDAAGTRSIGPRVIQEGAEDRSEVLAPPAPRRRRSTPGDGNRRPPNRNARDAEAVSPGGREDEAGGGGDSRGPGNRNSPGRGGGEGRPNPSQRDDGVDWLQRAQQFQQQTTGFLNTVYNQTAQGGRVGMLDIAAQGIGGVRGMASKFQQQQEARVAQAQAEADAAMQRALDPDDPMTVGDAAVAANAARQAASRASALGGAAKMAVRGAGVAGLAVGGAMAVQSGGQWYQQHAAQGMQRGGGFSEGFGFEMGIRTMALNPFISLEQSRKIMQSALQEGYTGKEFDTVTEFMAENLQRMNVDVATSVRVLQEQVQKGGQSLESVQTDLMTAQQMSANPDAMMTSGEFVESYQRGTEIAIEAGAEGTAAGDFGLATAGIFSEDEVLAGKAGPALQNATSNPIVQQWLINDLGLQTTSLAGALPEAMETKGGDAVAASLLRMMEQQGQPAIEMLANANGDYGMTERAVDQFMALNYMVKMSRAEARRYMEKIVGEGGIEGEIERNAESRREAATGGEVTDPGEGYRAGQAFGVFGEVFQGVGGGILQGLGSITGIDRLEEYGEDISTHSREQMMEKWALQQAEGMNPRIKALIDREGYAGDIKVKSAEGEEMTLLDATRNKNVLDQLVGGSAQIQVPGGEYGTLENLSAQEAAAEAGGGTTLVDLTDQAKEYLRLIKPPDHRTQTQRSADSGEDGASRNDPPAGQPPG